MIVLEFTTGATSTSAIAFTQNFNTNNNMTYSSSSNSVQILVPGVYEIIGSVTLTSAAADATGLTLYANDTAVSNAFVFDAAAADDTATVGIYDVIQVDSIAQNTYVSLTFMGVNTPTIVAGSFSVKKIN